MIVPPPRRNLPMRRKPEGRGFDWFVERPWVGPAIYFGFLFVLMVILPLFEHMEPLWQGLPGMAMLSLSIWFSFSRERRRRLGLLKPPTRTQVAIGKGVLVVLAVGFGGLCLAGIRFVYNVADSSHRVREDASAFGRESVRAICRAWDPRELDKRSSKILTKDKTPQQLCAMLARYGQEYGGLKRIIDVTTPSMTIWQNRSPARYAVKDEVDCEFVKGKGTIMLPVAQEGGDWQIDDFYVAPYRPSEIVTTSTTDWRSGN